MMVLADTSIWIDFFRSGGRREQMEQLIRQSQLVMHPLLIAELALGNLRNRRQALNNLEQLPQATVIRLSEVRSMIETRRLYGSGLGLIDAHMVATCLATPGTSLWTGDLQLARVARTLNIYAAFP